MRLSRRNVIAAAFASTTMRMRGNQSYCTGHYPLRLISNGKELTPDIDYRASYPSKLRADIEILKDFAGSIIILDNYGLKIADVYVFKGCSVELTFLADHPHVTTMSDGRFSAEADRLFAEYMKRVITSGQMRNRPDLLIQS